MKCITVRDGIDCRFMSSKGCAYKQGICYEIIEKCNGCDRSSKLSSGNYCKAFPEPKLKWKNGKCNLATHLSLDKVESKHKINPIKASKRARH